MDRREFGVDPRIETAETLPGGFYASGELFERSRDAVFATSWQYAADAPAGPGSANPITLLPGCLGEPLLITRDAGGAEHCLSNVCTHRASLVVAEPCEAQRLRCPYHGRSFGLDGRFLAMPEFEAAENFPRAQESLPELALAALGPLRFTSIAPELPFAEAASPLLERLAWLPWDRLVFAPERSRAYDLAAHWALYCDNYLEGLHVPFVHPGLNRALDYGSYRTELFPRLVLQIGLASGDGPVFDPPAGSPERGQRVAAYYAWLYPNTMLNLYPWGLSLNVVEPVGLASTRIVYRSYVWREDLLDRGAGADLDGVEMEDQAIVGLVQRGIRSRLYGRGRFSPTRERGVHHFHGLLAAALKGDRG